MIFGTIANIPYIHKYLVPTDTSHPKGKELQTRQRTNMSTTIYFFDSFSSNQTRSGYRFFDEGARDGYSAVNGWLRIDAGRGQDLWGDGKRGAPLLLRPAPTGDYGVETFVSADPVGAPSQPINTQIGLFVYQDFSNWIFFGLTNHDFSIGGTRSQGDGVIVTLTQNGRSSIQRQQNLTQDALFLRIQRLRDTWYFYCSLQYDAPWSLLTTVNLPLANHEVGMGVKTFDLTQLFGPCRGNFDYLLVYRSTTVRPSPPPVDIARQSDLHEPAKSEHH